MEGRLGGGGSYPGKFAFRAFAARRFEDTATGVQEPE